MAGKRVILLGTCGIDKREVAKRLVKASHGHEFKVVHFEHDFLTEKPFGSFLADPPHEQFRQWRDGWGQLEERFSLPTGTRNGDASAFDSMTDNLLLVMHGAIVKGEYGVRVPYDLLSLRRFNPELVLTLIDDVYDLWWRTEARAKGEEHRGRPTLEQLILARRAEQLAGDQIANHTGPPSRHFVLSVQHPSESAARLILNKPRVVYLSFPISEPRRMLASSKPDRRGVDQVNRFHKAAAEYQRGHQGVVFITPLGIDELPLARRLKDRDVRKTARRKDPPAVVFGQHEERWGLGRFRKNDECLSPGPPRKADQIKIPYEQLAHAAGSIAAEVRSRDYRLVLQADTLAVFNPVMNNAADVSGGVRNEVVFASTNPRNRGIYVYQDPREDEKERFKKWLGKVSNLGANPFADRIKMCESVKELLARASAP